MRQESSACELGKGGQGLGLKIVIVRGLSWCFWANRHQSSGSRTCAGQEGGCCPENVDVQTPGRAELHFREKEKSGGWQKSGCAECSPSGGTAATG